jgi:hypothetical protein
MIIILIAAVLGWLAYSYFGGLFAGVVAFLAAILFLPLVFDQFTMLKSPPATAAQSGSEGCGCQTT